MKKDWEEEETRLHELWQDGEKIPSLPTRPSPSPHPLHLFGMYTKTSTTWLVWHHSYVTPLAIESARSLSRD